MALALHAHRLNLLNQSRSYAVNSYLHASTLAIWDSTLLSSYHLGLRIYKSHSSAELFFWLHHCINPRLLRVDAHLLCTFPFQKAYQRCPCWSLMSYNSLFSENTGVEKSVYTLHLDSHQGATSRPVSSKHFSLLPGWHWVWPPKLISFTFSYSQWAGGAGVGEQEGV